MFRGVITSLLNFYNLLLPRSRFRTKEEELLRFECLQYKTGFTFSLQISCKFLINFSLAICHGSSIETVFYLKEVINFFSFVRKPQGKIFLKKCKGDLFEQNYLSLRSSSHYPPSRRTRQSISEHFSNQCYIMHLLTAEVICLMSRFRSATSIM